MAKLIKITSTFEMLIDLEDPRDCKEHKDLIEMMINDYNETLEEGSELVKDLSKVDNAVLHDVIIAEIENDVESVIDISDLTSEINFDVKVLS